MYVSGPTSLLVHIHSKAMMLLVPALLTGGHSWVRATWTTAMDVVSWLKRSQSGQECVMHREYTSRPALTTCSFSPQTILSNDVLDCGEQSMPPSLITYTKHRLCRLAYQTANRQPAMSGWPGLDATFPTANITYTIPPHTPHRRPSVWQPV